MTEHQRIPLFERLWSKVEKTNTCWVWRGATVANGHGHIQSGGRDGGTIQVHRAVWEIAVGPIPDGLVVCHHCDNPPCVRPSHLFLGTQGDNLRDMAAKGRGRQQKEPHFNAKLTAEQVEEVRRLIRMKVPMSRICSDFSVSRGTIKRIGAGHTYR